MSFATFGHQFHNLAILFNIFAACYFARFCNIFRFFFRFSISDVEQIFWPARGIVLRLENRIDFQRNVVIGVVAVDIRTPLLQNNSSRRSKVPNFS